MCWALFLATVKWKETTIIEKNIHTMKTYKGETLYSSIPPQLVLFSEITVTKLVKRLPFSPIKDENSTNKVLQ